MFRGDARIIPSSTYSGGVNMIYEMNSVRWLDPKDLPHEEWKNIKGFDGYKISNYGRVKSIKKDTRNGHCKNDKILKVRYEKKGYIHYALKKDNKSFERKAHRLVAEAFIPNIDNKPQVNHLDNNKANNYYKNLEWVTNSENQIHSVVTNPNRRYYFKENNPRKKERLAN